MIDSRPLGFALAGRPQQPHAQLGQAVLELAAVIVLVGHQHLPWPAGHQIRLGRQQLS
jgi:hypothetical protein